MTSDRFMVMFSRTEPWSQIGLFRRIRRVCRILVGSVLFSMLLLFIFTAIRGIWLSSSLWQAFSCILVIPVLALLAWAVGCMYIWRAVHQPWEISSGHEPPPPPPQDAPRLAPLSPFSPLILSEHAPLPDEHPFAS